MIQKIDLAVKSMNEGNIAVDTGVEKAKATDRAFVRIYESVDQFQMMLRKL